MALNEANSLRRIAMVVSHDKNFDEIYDQRFRKYCCLLSKEKEILSRMVRTSPSVNFSNSMEVLRKHSNQLHSQRTSDTVCVTNENLTARLNKTSKNISVSCEQLIEKPGDESNFMPRSSSAEFSPETFQRTSVNDLQSNFLQKNFTFKNRSIRDSKRASVNSLLNDKVKRSSWEELTRRKKEIQVRSCEDFTKLYHANECEQLLETKNSVPQGNSRQLDFKSNGLRHSNYLMTSSPKSLQAQNVGMAVEKKRLRSITPELEKRLAEAHTKSEKRAEVLRKLGEDFTKASQLIKIFKSTESLHFNVESNNEH